MFPACRAAYLLCANGYLLPRDHVLVPWFIPPEHHHHRQRRNGIDFHEQENTWLLRGLVQLHLSMQWPGNWQTSPCLAHGCFHCINTTDTIPSCSTLYKFHPKSSSKMVKFYILLTVRHACNTLCMHAVLSLQHEVNIPCQCCFHRAYCLSLYMIVQ